MTKLIQEVAAQAEPTFPYEGPFEDDTPTPTPTGEATVQLSSSSSSFEIGDTVTADLTIDSGNEEVDNYTIVITFDPAILEVVDANASQAGIQISFLDTFLSAQTNTADNTNGLITISTETAATSQTINRRVAEITFRAKASGASIVSINKSESSVTNDVSENILGTTTSLNFTVTGQTQDTTPPQDDELPSSGIFDHLGTFGSILAGIVMIYVGIRTFIEKKRNQDLDI